ncbi:MAG TPA: tetratricopeptide repeat protein [Bryobacteraceae bacterium]|nr:tetratricopeptide repeat protein [Bryobacteraceae bacterium]
MIENTKLLVSLFARPATAMSDILDRASLFFVAVAVLAVGILLQPHFPFSFYTPLFVLALVYVPGLAVLGKVLARIPGRLLGVFLRDYAPLFTCTAMAWSAANLPVAIAAWLIPRNQNLLLYLTIATYVYFLILVFFAVRTVLGIGSGTALAVVSFSWIPLVAVIFLWGPLRFVLGFLASPFVLLFLYYYLRSEASNLASGLRTRQNFRRMLDAAAVNPHDGEAQYQLGLIYQQRHQLTEAIRRFQTAIAIDPTEIDAHFQLGRIAFRQGRLKDALAEFQTVIDQDEKHHQSEILRELGALYNSVRQFEDGRRELATYVERRPYDPEGLYYYGQSLEGLGRVEEAREIYARAIDAARAAPIYLRRSASKWSRSAQRQIRKLPVTA